MRSFSTLAVLALPLLGSVFAAEPASPTKDIDESNSIYSSAHEAFQDLLNALPEESLQAALSGLKGFKDGVFESHHRGVEHVHDQNPALATKLIVAAVQDLKKRQTPSNSTSANPPPQSSDPQSTPPPQQPSSAAPPAPPQSTPSQDRPVIIPIPQTTTNAQGQTIIQTSSILSQVTASIPVTYTSTNAQGRPITATETRPAVIRTTTDAQGRTTAITSAANFAPTPGEVRTETDARGSTFVTTYTPGGGKISSVKLLTTTDANGKPTTITSYTFVDPAGSPTEANGGGAGGASQTGKPGLQTNAAVAGREVAGWVVVGGMLGWLL